MQEARNQSLLTRRRLLLTAALGTLVLGSGVGVRAALADDDPEIIERAMGDPDAPVTVIEYASLTCPHCGRFHNETMPALKERYIEAGKVHWIYRDYPLDQHALQAAVIAHCAPEDRYFRFLDVLYENQAQWSQAADPSRALTQLARFGGLSEERIQACLADEELVNRILQTTLEAQQKHGVQSTPSFVVNGSLYVGYRDVDEFAEILDPLIEGS